MPLLPNPLMRNTRLPSSSSLSSSIFIHTDFNKRLRGERKGQVGHLSCPPSPLLPTQLTSGCPT